jgi:hypothetical protein
VGPYLVKAVPGAILLCNFAPVLAPGTTAALPVDDVGPAITASAYLRWSGVISVNGISLKRRWSSCAIALPVTAIIAAASKLAFHIIIFVPPSFRDSAVSPVRLR